MKPKISIITACYNAEKYIAQTILSVQKQTVSDWEWLIVDDGSTDKSVDIIQTYCNKDQRIKLMMQFENQGPAVSRNKAISIAQGKYMTFIDADDLWLPNFLEENLKHIDNSFGFLCASYGMKDEQLKTDLGILQVPKKASYSDILKTNTISCLTAFIDIDTLGKTYMPIVAYRQDMGLWLKYLKKIPYVVGIQECLAVYRIRENSHSRSKKNLLKHQWYFYRKVENLSLVKSAYFFTFWVYYGIKKYYI